MKFCTNNNTCVDLNIAHRNKTIEKVGTTKFVSQLLGYNLKMENTWNILSLN
jgi:hypothetical protein